MANQSQQRPWFRLGSLARPVQRAAPAPAPVSAPRPQLQPPVGLLPRPTMVRPPFRPPVAPQPQAAQDAPATLPQSPPVTATPPPPPPAVVSPVSPPKLPSRIITSPISRKSPVASPVTKKSPLASPVTQESPPKTPVTQKSPPYASSVTQKSPLKSPVARKSPISPRASPVTTTIPSAFPLPTSSKPKTQSLPPSILSSTAIKQDVARSMLSPPIPVTPKPSNGLLSAVSIPPVVARISPPVLSPRSAKPLPETPPESPKIKSVLRSPPLFSLPPSQLKSDGEYERNIPAVAEQKTVRHMHDKAKPNEGEIKRVSNSEDIGMRVITISGENRGAVMELGHSHGSHHKLKTEATPKTRNSDNTSKAKPSKPMHAFTNSNVQGVNSSIVFNSTISHHDPGVHLSLARKSGKGGHSTEHENENELKIFQKDGGVAFRD
ncbi:hypothetical protein RND81_06G038400 [Saponaria officinalis]|uniref:Uncharacterized protein n=1 Tax=Saponaria officinalis TaxID=3572 RepID=A0AAW1K8M4_SAPOF